MLYDSDKAISSFSVFNFAKTDKSLLINGLNFSIPLKKREYSKFLLSFQLLCHETKSDKEPSVEYKSL